MCFLFFNVQIQYFRFNHCSLIFRKFQSNSPSVVNSTLKNITNKHIEKINLDLGDHSQLFSTDDDLDIFQDGNIFQNSDFQSLKLSNDGFLIQQEDNSNSKDDHQFHNFAILDEEELNINENKSSKHQKRSQNNKNKQLSIPNSNLKLPKKGAKQITSTYTLKNMELINKHNDYKIANSLFRNFFMNVIQNEGAIRDYNYKIPKFPNELNMVNLKNYLKAINSLDYNYNIAGNERLIFNQILELSQNILKFEGLVDIETMNELIQYFGNYGMTRKIFKILNQFEKLGILPNRDTLHLLIFKLSKIQDYESRTTLLKLYLRLGTSDWKISTDLTTKILIALITPPSKERLSAGKILINQGVDYDILKWNICEDYINLETQKKPKIRFKKFLNYLIKKNIIKNTSEDKKKTFSIYIKILANNNYGLRAIFEINKNKEFESTQNWYDLMLKSINDKHFWTSLAIFNSICHRSDLDVLEIIIPLFQKHRAIHEFFTRQKLKLYSYKNERNERISLNNSELPHYMYISFMKALQNLSGKKFDYVENFNGDKKFIDIITKDLEKIKLWEFTDNYKPYSNFTNIPNISKIYCLWDILEMNSAKYLCCPCKINPLTFVNLQSLPFTL